MSTGTPPSRPATPTVAHPSPHIELPTRLTADPNDPPAHHVRVVLDIRLRALLSHDPGARIGADVEDVHQMRVSVRRMRAALKAARPLLDASWSDELRAELGWLGHSLGPVRDLDVLLPRLRGLATDLPERERAVAERLIGAFGQDYLQARGNMLATLESSRYNALLEQLANAVRLPLPASSSTKPDPELIELVRAEYRTVYKRVHKVGDNPPDEVLHALRIKVKRLRYTGELAEPSLGRPVSRLLQATARLQEVLGDHQDAFVAQERIRELLPRLGQHVDPEVLFVAGRMTEREHARAEHLRTLWWDAWLRVSKRGEQL